MDRVSRAISLIHDLTVKLEVTTELHRYLVRILYFTQLQYSSEMHHSNIRLLSGDDIFFDGWNKSYIG
jgi:hypothetical protein